VVVLAADGPAEVPVPRATGARPEAGAVVAVPGDHFQIRARDPELGRRWRAASADAFQACFDAGLVAAWITRDGRYVFLPAAEVAR
jgi:hypothetical protein